MDSEKYPNYNNDLENEYLGINFAEGTKGDRPGFVGRTKSEYSTRKSEASTDASSLYTNMSEGVSLYSEQEIVTNEEIIREILNMNPMCTGHEEIPDKLCNRILVTWDGLNDPKNPRNWSVIKRLLATLVICACTASQYMGAAIITCAQEEIQEYFEVSHVKVQLGITLFVIGYAIGDLWWSPMSEMPLFRGRNPIYFGCQFLYAIMQIPLGLVTNFPGYCVLRLLSGIFASPPLSTAAASINDMWGMPQQTVFLVLWAVAQCTGPYLGPLLGAALTLTHSFRYIFWSLLAVSGGVLLIMLVLLPETSEQELLIRKAKKLRKETGDDRYIAPGEILLKVQTLPAVLEEMFLKPIKMTLVDPVLLLIDIHVGIVYTSMYLYLEAMPLVYVDLYGFNSVQLGLSFLPCIVGNVVGAAVFLPYIWYNQDLIYSRPEKVFGPAALVGALSFAIGQALWGWLSKESIHWAAGLVGTMLYGIGDVVVLNSYFSMMGSLFPPSVAGSAFASNNLVRGLMASCFPLFGHLVYEHTETWGFPVGWGCTILALFGFIFCMLPVFLILKGERLREIAGEKYAKR